MFELLGAFLVVLLCQARDQLGIQSFESVLELLEFWKNEELVLTFPAISAVEIASESVQVVVLPISIFLST